MHKEELFNNALYLITDRHQLPPGAKLLETLEEALRAGVRIIQLREKDMPAAELWPLCLKVRNLTQRYNTTLILNDRIDLALACGADGVHLGTHSLPTKEARKLLGNKYLIGVSTHSVEDITNAQYQGADFVTYGPVFHTPSKTEYGHPQGLDKLENACRKATIPLLALGGIKTENVQEVLSRGASGVALISAIISHQQPGEASKEFINILR